jgi:16S rRNA (guanine527-N7)-methyltransferase
MTDVADDGEVGGAGDRLFQEAPPQARACFGSRIELAEEYARLLAGPGVERGLIGPREVERLWDRHILNCAVVAELVAEGAAVCDVGSGAGLPGLALAIARPDLTIALLEPLLRRTVFLTEAVDRLELERVSVVRGRAEEHAGQMSVDVVTARAVAPLERLAGWALPLLRPGGELLALKGDSAPAELRAAGAELRRLGAEEWSIVQVGVQVVRPPTTVVRIRAGHAHSTGSGRGSRSRTRTSRGRRDGGRRHP